MASRKRRSKDYESNIAPEYLTFYNQLSKKFGVETAYSIIELGVALYNKERAKDEEKISRLEYKIQSLEEKVNAYESGSREKKIHIKKEESSHEIDRDTFGQKIHIKNVTRRRYPVELPNGKKDEVLFEGYDPNTKNRNRKSKKNKN